MKIENLPVFSKFIYIYINHIYQVIIKTPKESPFYLFKKTDDWITQLLL